EGDLSSYNSITSIDIKELRLCNQPTDICQTVSQTTDTEATLTWTDNNSPAASSFSVFYKQADNSTDEYLQLTANAPTAKPEGLQPNTLYSVYVTAHCGDKGESYNSLPASFSTLHSFPYTETMVQDPNITKIINGKPVSVPGPGPLDRGFRTATGTLPTNGTTAASLSFIANPVSNDEAFCPYSTYALLNDAKAIPNALGVREYVKEGWLVSSGIYITNDGLPLKISFKANSAQQIDNEWVKGNLPSKFNKVKLYVLVSKNGDFTRNDVVSTIDVSGETVDGKEYTVDIPAIAGIAYVAFFFNNPDANPARDEAEGQEPPAMLFEIYDLHFETAGYNLTLNVSPENAGTVTGGGIYKTDAPVTVTATANENYAFVAWMDGEDVVSTDASHSFPMPDGNRTYTAKFRSLI
ncbi:MAG: fibronectin type III domain-containing protein, partial [Bacteroidales bacterium]|nr:fibronectin type III domain-containing protein [Bacteroidales bacterium]